MKYFFIIFVIIFVKLTFANIEEAFLMNNLMQYFDENGDDFELLIDEGSDLTKREILLNDFAKNSKLQLDAKNEKKRPNHYWTRKRGRETTNNWWNYYETNYDFRPNQFGYPNSIFYTRGKRGAIQSLIKQQLAKLRIRRQADENQETKTEKEPDLDTQKPVEAEETTMTSSNNDGKSKPKRRNQINLGNFRNSMMKCCSHEGGVGNFNQTLFPLKTQCQKDISKLMPKVQSSPFGYIDNEDEVLSVKSSNIFIRLKTMMLCTMDCVAKKIGMIDDKGIINTEVAKKVVIENFAVEKWEKEAADGIVEKCVQKVNESKRENVDSMGVKCSIKTAEFGYCIWKNLFLICPADKQTKNKRCEELRKSLES